MVTTLYRIIKYGLKNFWRQRLVTLATLTVILLALLVFQGLLIFNSVAGTVLQKLQDKIDISVYFKTNASEDEILRIQKSLEGLPEVKPPVEYVSKDAALETFKKKHENDANISKALEELEENPLPASLNIKAVDPRKYGAIAAYLENADFKDLIEEVSYSENQVVIDKLASIISISRQAGILLTIVLSLIAIVVSFNTILLAIYANREEIGIMRLVGASNSFIRGPFIIEGIIYGFIATVLSVLITLPVIYFVSPFVKLLSDDIDLIGYYGANFFTLFGYQLIFGIAIGVISSFIAIRKYLKI